MANDTVHGVVVIDKPAGMTSHDVVARVRRKLGVRRVGHAGTLDPMATGVLVVMVGHATKLGPYLTAEDKSYRATVQLGRATDTLDTQGTVLDEQPLAGWWPSEAAARVERSLEQERARRQQDPPRYSAIKIDGKAAYARARAGEEVALAARPVAVRKLELDEIVADAFRVSMTVSKGYYVRSLARDLGERLGMPACLSALRRTASGAFTLDDAQSLDSELTITPIAQAVRRCLPAATLNEEGVARARCGGPMTREHFSAAPRDDTFSAWLGPDGRLVAIGSSDGGAPRVVRGFDSV